MLQYVVFPALALFIVFMLIRRFTAVLRQMARSPEARTVLLSALTLLAGGTYVFHSIEQWSILDSLYFCVISLTTVGYGDVTPATDAGKIMAMIYIVLGLGIIMALVTTVAQVSMEQVNDSGALKSALGRRHQKKHDE